jgi:serine phosphatase RsbU (regulator of sigma subunit)
MSSKKYHTIVELARKFLPSLEKQPNMKNIDIFGISMPLHKVGGDLIGYLDFDKETLEETVKYAGTDPNLSANIKKFMSRTHMVLGDVSGHGDEDSMIAGALWYSFITASEYELKLNGRITSQALRYVNGAFSRRFDFHKKYAHLLYGNVGEEGIFRFITAGGPLPVYYSTKEGKINQLDHEKVEVVTPLGMDRNADYNGGPNNNGNFNRINLSEPGDTLLVFSDGLKDQGYLDNKQYFAHSKGLLRTLNMSNRYNWDAHTTSLAIQEDLLDKTRWGKRMDDISYFVIKRK